MSIVYDLLDNRRRVSVGLRRPLTNAEQALIAKYVVAKAPIAGLAMATDGSVLTFQASDGFGDVSARKLIELTDVTVPGVLDGSLIQDTGKPWSESIGEWSTAVWQETKRATSVAALVAAAGVVAAILWTMRKGK